MFHKQTLRLGIEGHSGAFLGLHFGKEIVGMAHQFGFLPDGVGPQPHLFLFGVLYLTGYAVHLPKCEKAQRYGERKDDVFACT